MARDLTKEELTVHKNAALGKLSQYMETLINDPDRKTRGKADKLSYWLENWATYLEYEPHFSPSSLRRYKRREIIKAHLGYNVGSEEGGLHYCVVLDKNNARTSPVVTVIPLTSVKAKTDLKNLHSGNIYLGNELFTNLSSKILHTKKSLVARVTELDKPMSNYNRNLPNDVTDFLSKELNTCYKELDLLERMSSEVNRMKIGSIAIVPQITTISKIRIYDPKTNYDVLSNVKLSNEKLDLIDCELIRLYTGNR